VFEGASRRMFYEIRRMREYIMSMGVFGLKGVRTLGGCVIPSLYCTHMAVGLGIIKTMKLAFKIKAETSRSSFGDMGD
jgi:hypothetical protein